MNLQEGTNSDRSHDEILTLKEVSALLRIGESTLYHLALRGELPAYKVGREWRFMKGQIFQWFREKADSSMKPTRKKVFDSIEDGIAVIDRQYRVVLCNPAYIGNKTLKDVQLEHEHCYRLSLQSENPCPEALCPIRKVFDTGRSSKMNRVRYTDDGHELYYDVIALPLKNQDGEVFYGIEIFRDQTDIHDLNRRLNWIADFVAFEIKSKLANSMMNLGALTNDNLFDMKSPEERKAILSVAISSLKGINDMLRNHLTSSSYSQGHLKLTITDSNVERDILSPVLKDMEPALTARQMSVVTTVSLSSPLACDCGLMKIALNNLIDNATKYGTERTKIHCHVAEAGNDVLFTVFNEGIGIPPTRLMDVFKEYVHFDTEGQGSTGLGLHIVKMIAEQHGGTVSAESGYIIENSSIPYSDFEAARERFGITEDKKEKLKKFARFVVRIPKSINEEVSNGDINILKNPF
jgi:excisionase family DNA binding protein